MRVIGIGLVVIAAVLAAATSALANEFFAFDPSFSGGAQPVDCRDVDFYGTRWLIVAAGPGGLPEVRAYYWDGAVLRGPVYRWLAYDQAFAGGVHVTCGVHVLKSRDGQFRLFSIVTTAPGEGGGPHIRTFVFDPSGLLQ